MRGKLPAILSGFVERRRNSVSAARPNERFFTWEWKLRPALKQLGREWWKWGQEEGWGGEWEGGGGCKGFGRNTCCDGERRRGLRVGGEGVYDVWSVIRMPIYNVVFVTMMIIVIPALEGCFP